MSGRAYLALLGISVLAGAAGILTLFPANSASYPNLLGYRSLCTFAPAATFFCFSAAGVTCVLRASLVKRRAMAGGKPVFRAVPIVVVAMVLALGIASTVWFGSFKGQYLDATTHATEN